MRVLFVLMAALVATETGAVEVVSVQREVSYRGGLEQPGTILDSRGSDQLGPFHEELADTVSSPPDAEAGADASQLSYVGVDAGSLVITADTEVGTHATTLVGGTIADALSQSKLELVFTTDVNTQLTVDVVISSSMGLFYDGPGVGEVASSHVASFLLCVVGGGCLADLLVEDVTDNALAVADGVQDSIELPAGAYEIQLLTISQSVSRDVGSTLGGADIAAEITVEPLPEPGALASSLTAVVLIAALYRHRRAAP